MKKHLFKKIYWNSKPWESVESKARPVPPPHSQTSGTETLLSLLQPRVQGAHVKPG